MFWQIIFFSFFGCLGAFGRFFLTEVVNRAQKRHKILPNFSIANIIVNFLACMLVGCALALYSDPDRVFLANLLIIALAGSLSTWSAMIAELYGYLVDRKFFIAVIYLATQLISGFFALYISYYLTSINI